MKLAVQRTSTAIAVFATAGISGLFMGAAPASAVTNPCGTGTLVSGNICQQIFTATTATNFVPPAKTSKLEALLVGGGGGAGAVTADPTATPASNGYAVGGGGGQVKIVNFTASVGSKTPLVVTVGAGGEAGNANGGAADAGGASTVTGGAAASADGGGAASDTTGGDSGTYTGASNSDGQTPETFYGGGAGAGGSATGLDGGPGVSISTTFHSDPLFGSDPSCYGGGGASQQGSTVGAATCGGNAPSTDPAATSYPAIIANSGGGGAATLAYSPVTGEFGSDGVVVFRWFAPATLATTGGGPNGAELPFALGALAVGAALVGTTLYRRNRKATS